MPIIMLPHLVEVAFHGAACDLVLKWELNRI